MTLQIASNPTQQYELSAKPLAPVVHKSGPSPNERNSNMPMKYDAGLDSHTYLTAPHESAQVLRLTNHVTSYLSVLPSSEINEEALTKLQEPSRRPRSRQRPMPTAVWC